MKVFLSYPSEQIKAAEEIYEFLHDHGIDVWFDKKSIFGGQDREREIQIAQENAQLFVLVCSKEIVTKPGIIQVEIKEILERVKQQPFGHVFLICLRTERLQLPYEMMRWQYIDYFDRDWKTRLAKSIMLKYNQLGLDAPDRFAGYVRSMGELGVVGRSIDETIDQMTFVSSFFVYEQKGSYWTYVNSEIVQSVYEDYYKNIRSYEDSLMRMEPAAWEFNVQESFRVDQIVSLRMTYYNYMERRPYPNIGVLTKNFCGQNCGRISITDVLKTDEENSKLLMRDCDNKLEYPLDLHRYFDRYNWDIFSEFTFDSKGLNIVFTPGAIFPHAVGIQEIYLPWVFLDGRVSDWFAKTVLAKIM
jgi:TIR domain-containing protein/uncharacterized protein DUF3298